MVRIDKQYTFAGPQGSTDLSDLFEGSSQLIVQHVIAAYKEAHGWTFPWYSSHGSNFNYDFHLTLNPAIVAGAPTAPVSPGTRSASRAPRGCRPAAPGRCRCW